MTIKRAYGMHLCVYVQVPEYAPSLLHTSYCSLVCIVRSAFYYACLLCLLHCTPSRRVACCSRSVGVQAVKNLKRFCRRLTASLVHREVLAMTHMKQSFRSVTVSQSGSPGQTRDLLYYPDARVQFWNGSGSGALQPQFPTLCKPCMALKFLHVQNTYILFA